VNFISCIYKPPYTLKLSIGGLEFNLKGDSYEEYWSLEIPLAGKYRVKAIIESPVMSYVVNLKLMLSQPTVRIKAIHNVRPSKYC